MRACLAFALAAILFACPAAFAAPRIVNADLAGTQDAPQIEVVSSNQNGVELVFDLPALSSEDFTIDGRAFRSLTIPGGGLTGETGQPGIPTFTRLVAIPAESGVWVSAVAESQEELTGVDLLPVQSEDGVAFSLDSQAYSRDEFGIAPIAAGGEPALCRDLRVIPLTFQPVQYNPARHTVKITSRIRVQVRFDGRNTSNSPTVRHSFIPTSFDRLYRELVVNYEGPPAGTEVANGTWLCICPNDAAVTSRLQTLADWHQRQGIPTRIVTTAETGSTTASILAYIQNAYNNWPIPPEFVVMAGDATGTYTIPCFFTDGGEGDHPYTQLAGGDLIGDVNIGRISYDNLTQLDVIIAKSVGYASNPSMVDPGWFTRATLCGDPGSSGYSTVQVMQWVKTRLRQIGYSSIDTIFSGSFSSLMRTSLSRGETVFCYRGYVGMSGFTNTDVNNLTNYWELPFSVISTCGTGDFDSNTSLTEGFLRAGSVDNPKGAIGSIGTATLSTHTRYNNCFTMGVWQAVLYENQWEMGAAHTRGKTELFLNYGQGDPNAARDFCTWNNLMGDPACQVWTEFPTTMTAVYADTIPVGASSFSVHVNEQLSNPCAGAQVCLWKGSEIYAVGTTNAAGNCELPISGQTPGLAKLTITKHNRKPILLDVPVASRTLFLGYASSAVDDDALGESSGNGNGQIEPRETIELRVQVRNFGSVAATGVTATLTTTDPYVTIVDNQENYGTINPGVLVWCADDFGFTVGPGCPDGHVVRFGLDISSGSNQWHSLIDLPVVSADLEAGTVTLYGSVNGILDPGETVGMSVRLANNGAAAANATTGTLTSLSSWITISDAQGNFGTIPVGGNAENTVDRFTVSAAPETFQGYLAVFSLVTQFNGGALDTTYVTLTVGTRTSDDPIGPDAYGYYAFDNTDTTYPDAPTYNWIEIDPALGGSGTQVQLGDFADYQDKSRTVDLPFIFQYYGQPFSKATICSNGWVAMGTTYQTDYRNWTIPGAGAPQNILAVNWDDLLETTTAHVYQWHDVLNHRWIVEWSRLNNVTGGTVTVEAILYDPAFLHTPTGDGVIVFQYNQIAQTDTVDGYSTEGIQNGDHTVGLLYSYYNRYPAGAATLASGRAVKFVPVAIVPMGTLQGFVGNASHGNSPISGASVTVLQNGRSYITGADGRYGGGMAAGTYTVAASHPSFAADTLYNVIVVEQQATTRDFSLTDILGPAITNVTQIGPSTSFHGPYPVDATITDDSGITQARIVYRISGGGWIELPLSPAGDVYSASIPAMPGGVVVDYYVRAQDGAGLISTLPADAPASYYRFFVTDEVYNYPVEDPGDPGWHLGMPGDAATTGVWTRDDPVGTNYNGQDMQPENDHTTDPGVKCFVTGNGTAGAPAGDADVDGGCTTLQSPPFNLSTATSAFITYWRWYGEGGNSSDDEFAVDVSSDGGTNWVPLERVPEIDAVWRRVSFDLTPLISLTSNVVVRFVACDLNTAGLVEAAIDDVVLDVFTPNTTGAPEAAQISVFQLQANRPNPFRQSTSLAFSLARAGRATLSLFDVQGREVRKLIDGVQSAGEHTLVWDGLDDRGANVPSGIYFMRLRTEGNSDVRKVIRLE